MHVPKNPFDSTAPSDFTPPVRQQFKLSHSVKYASCLTEITQHCLLSLLVLSIFQQLGDGI